MRLAEFCVPTQSTSIKKDSLRSLIYGVVNVTILEPMAPDKNSRLIVDRAFSQNLSVL